MRGIIEQVFTIKDEFRGLENKEKVTDIKTCADTPPLRSAVMYARFLSFLMLWLICVKFSY